jgi:hypothetical protein
MYQKLTNCKYCNISLENMNSSTRANHSRWCVSNPKRVDYVNALAKHREGIVSPRNQFTKAKDEGRTIPPGTMTGKPGSMLGKKHSVETKLHLKEKALASPHRRLVRSIRKYTKKDGTIVNLDSSWEEALAIRLDNTNIDWIRPDPIKWIDNDGITHNYFPDFYLIDYDIYLDPKNPYAIKAQEDKIACLTKQIKNLIIIKGLEECRNYTPPW